jgi:hypothetical protein
VQRGIPTLILCLLAAAALGVWGWSLGARNSGTAAGAGGETVINRPVPARGWGPMRVMTANIRLSEPDDGDNAWANRRELVVKVFLKIQPEIIACQEVSPAQGAYLNKELAQWYAYYPRGGVAGGGANAGGSTDGARAGAANGAGAGGRTGGGAGAELLGLLNQSLASLNTMYYRSDRFEAIDGEAGLVLPDQPQAQPTETPIFRWWYSTRRAPAPARGIRRRR